MSGKESITRVGDLVLVHHENQPIVYARIEAIEPDVKKNWFQVSLMILTIPPQSVTWILREEYINGEGFTMGGKPMKLERVKRDLSGLPSEENGGAAKSKGPCKTSKVLKFKKQH